MTLLWGGVVYLFFFPLSPLSTKTQQILCSGLRRACSIRGLNVPISHFLCHDIMRLKVLLHLSLRRRHCVSVRRELFCSFLQVRRLKKSHNKYEYKGHEIIRNKCKIKIISRHLYSPLRRWISVLPNKQENEIK